ncbi:hypothetical protein SUGI_0076270 [Cryptomeria japonica]|nr:hypothetical protein SUGI_0076270 [Cryptomeria japonica]
MLMQDFHAQFVWRISKWVVRFARCPVMNATLIVLSHGWKRIGVVQRAGLKWNQEIRVNREIEVQRVQKGKMKMKEIQGLLRQRIVIVDHVHVLPSGDQHSKSNILSTLMGGELY